MTVRFLGQPFEEQVGAQLKGLLADKEHTSFLVITAWGKRSGLSRLGPAIRSFVDRGGDARAVLGIDEGGATREGLELAMEVFDPVHIFHDPGTRTFHPKIYVVGCDYKAVAIVGSANLTKGGLYTNYEAALSVELDLSRPEGVEIRDDITAFYETLLDAGDACQELSEALLAQLAEDPRYGVMSEAVANKRRASRRTTDSERLGRSIFGEPIRDLAGAPDPDMTPVEHDEEDEDATVPDIGPKPSTEDDTSGITGFWKALSNWDTNPSSAPGQIVIPIRFLEFFEPLTVQRDESATGGVRQSHALFKVVFVDGEFEKEIDEARAILYEPAASHPRENVELRFTFHDREVSERLSRDDILAFERADDRIRVELHPPGSFGPGRFGHL